MRLEKPSNLDTLIIKAIPYNKTMSDMLDNRETKSPDLPSRLPDGSVTRYFMQLQERRDISLEGLGALRKQFYATLFGQILHEFMPNQTLPASKLDI